MVKEDHDMTQPDELTRLQTWNASLRENITHIAGQLVERTAECAELRGQRDAARELNELWSDGIL